MPLGIVPGMKTPPSNTIKSFPSALGTFRALPMGIWALGFVSMFMDISSELIHSLLPVFMSTVLGASMTTIGLGMRDVVDKRDKVRDAGRC
jgi:hypothetical protein